MATLKHENMVLKSRLCYDSAKKSVIKHLLEDVALARTTAEHCCTGWMSMVKSELWILPDWRIAQ